MGRMFTSRVDNVTHRQLNNRRVEALKWTAASAQRQASWWGISDEENQAHVAELGSLTMPFRG